MALTTQVGVEPLFEFADDFRRGAQSPVGKPQSRPHLVVASIVGLSIALGAGFVLPFLPGQAHQRITDVSQDTVIVVFEWSAALAILAIVLFWERLPLGSVGFRAPSLRDFVVTIVAAVAMYAVSLTLNAVAPSASNGVTPAAVATIPLTIRIALFLTGGFCEELLYRAYPIERLVLFTGKYWISGAAAIAFFTLAHVPRYGFSVPLVDVAIIATFLTAVYLRTRNFWMCAILHAFVDFVGLVVEPAFAAHGAA